VYDISRISLPSFFFVSFERITIRLSQLKINLKLGFFGVTVNKKEISFFIVVVFQPVNHSIFTMDLQYTEENSYPLTRRVDLMKLFGNHRPQKSQNVALDNSKVIEKETTKETLSVSPSKEEMDVDMYHNIQEMESKHGREPTVVFMGHYDNEEDEWPELLPGFITVDYYGKNSEIVPTFYHDREKVMNAFPLAALTLFV